MKVFQNKSLINIFVEEGLNFGELHLNENYNYYRNGKILSNSDTLEEGNNWLSFRCKLRGGKPGTRFKEVQIELYVIYTSMEKLISLGKVDLIGLDAEMYKWLMTAIDYDTDCKVSILEVENKGEDFWDKIYKKFKRCDEIVDWMKFLGDHPLKLSKMTEHKWEMMFKEAVKNNMQDPRTRCMFIVQIYHGGHKNLYESIYANFSLFHQVVWSFRCMMDGKQNDKIKILAKSFSENKKSNQFRNFYNMQCGEPYSDQTLVMNSVQKVLMQETNKLRNLENKVMKWHQPEFWDNTFKNYLDDLMHLEWKITMTELGLTWRNKRAYLNRITESEKMLCWNAILKNVKPSMVNMKKHKLKKV
jgi:hypothetical protein